MIFAVLASLASSTCVSSSSSSWRARAFRRSRLSATSSTSLPDDDDDDSDDEDGDDAASELSLCAPEVPLVVAVEAADADVRPRLEAPPPTFVTALPPITTPDGVAAAGAGAAVAGAGAWDAHAAVRRLTGASFVPPLAALEGTADVAATGAAATVTVLRDAPAPLCTANAVCVRGDGREARGA